jgi:hypothetical protein
MLVVPDKDKPGDFRQAHLPTVREAAYSALGAVDAHDKALRIFGMLFDKIIPAIVDLQTRAGIPETERLGYRPPEPKAVDGTEVAPGPDEALIARADGSKFWRPLGVNGPDLQEGETLIHVGPKPPTQAVDIPFVPSTAKIQGAPAS